MVFPSFPMGFFPGFSQLRRPNHPAGVPTSSRHRRPWARPSHLRWAPRRWRQNEDEGRQVKWQSWHLLYIYISIYICRYLYIIDIFYICRYLYIIDIFYICRYLYIIDIFYICRYLYIIDIFYICRYLYIIDIFYICRYLYIIDIFYICRYLYIIDIFYICRYLYIIDIFYICRYLYTSIIDIFYICRYLYIIDILIYYNSIDILYLQYSIYRISWNIMHPCHPLRASNSEKPHLPGRINEIGISDWCRYTHRRSWWWQWCSLGGYCDDGPGWFSH